MYINQILRQARDVNPGRPAFVSMSAETISYQDFAQRAFRLAAGFHKLAPQSGARIGVLAMSSINYVASFLGVIWSGRVIVPLNIRCTPQELAYMIKDADIEVLCVDAHFVGLIEPIRAAGVCVREWVFLDESQPPEGLRTLSELLECAPAEEAPTTADTLATIVYTGGTTGVPKGVMHTQASLFVSSANAALMGLPPHGSHYLQTMPMFHVAGFAPIFTVLLQSGTITVLPMFRPDLLIDAVRRLPINALALAPTMYAMLLDAPGFDSADFAKVQLLAYGASPMPRALLSRVMAAFPNAALAQVYGMTECGVAAVLSDVWHRGPNAQLSAAGQPGPFYQIRIVAPDGQEMPRGQLGEVVLYGPGVMRGYLNKPEATAQALQLGGMRSGDAGIMDENGVVTLLDRVKDMIVTGGENVYSVEVENTIASHPAVAACAVIGIPDDKYGEAVHAVVVLRTGATLDITTLRNHCAKSIAGYKCPRSIEVRESLPLSGVNKILKQELRAPHWAGKTRMVN